MSDPNNRIHEVLYQRKHGKKKCLFLRNDSKLQIILFNMLMENLLPKRKGGTIL
jgi:hypothetical protein